MVYATYKYYIEEYSGAAISDELVFNRMVRRASQYIDRFTFGRINEGNVETFPSLPACACDMADTLFFALGENGSKKEVKSETTDGYSVTYVTEGADGKTAEEKLDKKLYSIAKLYLINTDLLYCGVDIC